MKKALDVKVPGLPNFIMVGKEYVPLSNFTEAELRAIGKEWTDALVELWRKKVENERKGVFRSEGTL